MKRILFTSLAVLLLSVCAPAQGNAPAQDRRPTMTLTGVVYDTNGAVIVTDMKIVINGVSGAPYETATNDEGIYKIKLPLGVYRVRVSAVGFCAAQVERFKVVDSTYGKMSLDFVLEVPKPEQVCGQENPPRKPEKEKGGKPKIEIIME
jgi:hypothetical protein